MVQALFRPRQYSLVVEHSLNPDWTPCVGTGKTEEPKKVAVIIFSKIPESTHLSKLFQS